MNDLLSDTSFWTFVGLIIFFGVIIALGVPKVLVKALDDRANTIREELDEARRLREEAQELMATYERKQVEATAEAEAIIRQAKTEADCLRQNAKTEIAQRIERRTALAEQRIAQAEIRAAKDIKALAADMAVDAAEQLLSEKLSKTRRNALINADIAALKDRLK